MKERGDRQPRKKGIGLGGKWIGFGMREEKEKGKPRRLERLCIRKNLLLMSRKYELGRKVLKRELEAEVSNLKAELTVTKGEKNRSEQEAIYLKREVEGLEKDLRTRDSEIQKLDSKDESTKSLITQTNERLYELKDENHTLKQDKDKMASKMDHLLYENDNLRNEIFMLKKIMLEVEKRDLQVGTLVYDNIRRDDRGTRKESRHVTDLELEPIRSRPERRR